MPSFNSLRPVMSMSNQDFNNLIPISLQAELINLLTKDPTLDPIHEVNMALHYYISSIDDDFFACSRDQKRRAKKEITVLTKARKAISDLPWQWGSFQNSSNYLNDDKDASLRHIDAQIGYYETLLSTPGRPGRHFIHAKNNLISEWIYIYHRGVGKLPTITVDPYKDTVVYKSKFIDLTKCILKLVSYTPVDSEIHNQLNRYKRKNS